MTSQSLNNPQRFSQMLVLLYALDPTRGERAEAGPADRDIRWEHATVRRSFVDAIAYICAKQRGPKYVTAAALQKREIGITVWLAGNEAIESDVTRFLGSILSDLTEIARPDRGLTVDQTMSEVTENLLPRIIEFETPKLQGYYDVVIKTYISPCLEVIGSALTQGSVDTHRLSALEKWLKSKFPRKQSLVPQGQELETLVRECYDLRQSSHCDTFGKLGAQGQNGHQGFQSLYKLLGKLGKPMAVSRALAKAAISFPPEFRDGFEVRAVPPQPTREVPRSQKMTFEDIINCIFSSKKDQEKYLDRLKSLSRVDDISKILKRNCQFNSRVHAELLLLDHFFKNGYEFVARDRYIACSKPACHLCYAYISNHPGNFKPPPSHHKIYKNWRVPEVDPEDHDYLEIAKDLSAMLAQRIEKELFAEIGSYEPRRPKHADSPA